MRDYDKEPIEIIDRAVYFQEKSLFLSIVLFYSAYTTNATFMDIIKGDDLFMVLCAVVLFIAQIWWYVKCNFQASYFTFYNDKLFYNFMQGTEPNKICNLTDIEKISFCVLSELMDSFGRFHYLTSYELYKKSSIGVHIGKLALFLYYTINFILLVLPFKIFMLIKNKEPLSLLNKNVVIKFKNRNYFLINIYSKRELDEILWYCKDKNIAIEQKTNFIPHWQNFTYFTDKNEIWSDDFSDTEIPKDTFKRKLRQFFSLD